MLFLRKCHLQEFSDQIRHKAVLLFCDNTHAIGCLLKGSTTVRERGVKRNRHGEPIQSENTPYSHFDEFCKLPIGLRRTMNEQARAIWTLIRELDVIVWIEYVNTDCNIADPPSRGKPLPRTTTGEAGRHIREYTQSFRVSGFD